MATKKCPNGHLYDTSIYDHCPFCPSADNTINFGPVGAREEAPTRAATAGPTNVERPTAVSFNNDLSDDMPTKAVGGFGAPSAGATSVMGGYDDGKTVIRGAVSSPSVDGGSSKKLVALLTSYSATVNPMGEVFKIYEGRTVVGREFECDVVINDNELSSKHFTLLCRSVPGVQNRFFLKDNMSTNGTFVNGNIEDEQVELKNFDKITIGSTELTFIIIPQE